MESTWLELRIRVPAAATDLVCSQLAALGSTGVTVEERALDTFTPPDPEADPPREYQLKAYFPGTEKPEGLAERVRERLAGLAERVPGLVPHLPQVLPVRNEDWAEGWKQHFGAVRIGRRLVIKPSWESFAAAPGDVLLELDPGMAFGTGTHGTTRLCLEVLAEAFEGEAVPRRVLDVGTGSGILALAAAALGARRVLACDVEAEACRTARDNARGNGLADRVEVTDRPLDALEDGFDLVLANILAEENVRLAPELVARLAPAGVLVLSGILREKEALVVDAFNAYALAGPEFRRRGDWSCLVYRQES